MFDATIAWTLLDVPLATRALQAPPLSRFVQIEPVGQRNLRCQMCPIQFRKDGPPHGPLAFLPFDDFKRRVAIARLAILARKN